MSEADNNSNRPGDLMLIVDDSSDDSILLKHEFRHAGVLNPVICLSGGAEAISYLEGEGKYRNRAAYPMPTVLLLDLKMPGIDGFSVLSWINQRPELRPLLVVVLSGLADLKHVNRAYELGANSYLTKPTNPHDLANLANFFRGYWTIAHPIPQAAPSAPCASSAPREMGGARQR